MFITAHDETETRDRALKTGCVAYLRKAEPGETLREAILRAVRKE